MKKISKKIVALTCYDYSMASILDEAGVDILLVGDSLAMVMMGEKDTKNISLEQMLPFALGVRRGAKKAKVVFDMPIGTYDTPAMADKNVQLISSQTGIEAVKIEGRPDIVEYLVAKGVTVMGHTGLKPQTAEKYKVVGEGTKQRRMILDEALAIAAAGADYLVLECVPAELALEITQSVEIPTIGIGAGRGCNGQILVLYDLVNLYPGLKLKFVRQYADFRDSLKKAVLCFTQDVENGEFPSSAESF